MISAVRPSTILPHVVLDDLFALVIKRAGCFIKNQYPRIPNQRPRNRDPLPLAAGQAAAALAHNRVIAFWQLQDEIVRASKRCRCNDPFHRHRWIGQRNVRANRGVEKDVFLQHHADLPSQPGRIDHGEVDAIDQDFSALRNVKTLNELGDRTFPRSGWTDDPDDLSSGHIEINIVQDFGPIDAIAERYMLEFDGAGHGRKGRSRSVIGWLGGVFRISPNRATESRA